MSTLTRDLIQVRVGLLYDLSQTLSERNYDIEVVIIETQGRKAMDVFYVTGSDGKLAPVEGERLRDGMLAACGPTLHEKAG